LKEPHENEGKGSSAFGCTYSFSLRSLRGVHANDHGGPAVDAEVNKIMTETHANGMAVPVIDHGKVV
jgi:hypothetical protein